MLIKRALDVVMSVLLIIVSGPLQLVTACLVRWQLGSPILFRQVRAGLHGEPFTLYKFRSMENVDPAKNAVSNDQRMTPFGRWLRATSVDELPSLVNILKGDMSMVGPRPLRIEYTDRYSATQARRHNMRPGLTGLAQVSGRNAMEWEVRLILDVWYIDNFSFWLDLEILWRTIGVVLSRNGVTASDGKGMTEFLGAEEV